MDRINHILSLKLTKKIPKNNYLSSLPIVKNLQRIKEISFKTPITFLVGENGIGKSTIIEAIAINYGFNPEGGTKDYNFVSKNTHSNLSEFITLVKSHNYAKNGYFLRAESFYNLLSYRGFLDDLYTNLSYMEHMEKYKTEFDSYHQMSHGESFLELMDSFSENGLYILDEPESALSPIGIMRLIIKINELVKLNSQFIISTHSPMLITMPNSTIYQLTNNDIKETHYKHVEHYAIVRKFLDNPEKMLKELLEDD